MSYIKNCKECGQRISLREMPGGQWVAFDVHTDKVHEHFTTSKNSKAQRSKRTAQKAKKATGKVTNNAATIVDRDGEEHRLNQTQGKWLDLTTANKLKLFNWLVENQFSVKIEYIDRDGDGTTRSIFPITILGGTRVQTAKVEAWCKLRNDSRTFALSKIGELFVEGRETKIPPKKPTVSKPKDTPRNYSATESYSNESRSAPDEDSNFSFSTLIWIGIAIYFLFTFLS